MNDKINNNEDNTQLPKDDHQNNDSKINQKANQLSKEIEHLIGHLNEISLELDKDINHVKKLSKEVQMEKCLIKSMVLYKKAFVEAYNESQKDAKV